MYKKDDIPWPCRAYSTDARLVWHLKINHSKSHLWGVGGDAHLNGEGKSIWWTTLDDKKNERYLNKLVAEGNSLNLVQVVMGLVVFYCGLSNPEGFPQNSLPCSPLRMEVKQHPPFQVWPSQGTAAVGTSGSSSALTLLVWGSCWDFASSPLVSENAVSGVCAPPQWKSLVSLADRAHHRHCKWWKTGMGPH